MASFRFDQAEGLRRMVSGPRPRVLTVLSSAPDADKTALLVNLAASLHQAGSQALLLDACGQRHGVARRLQPGLPSLMAVARGAGSLSAAVANPQEGLQLATLCGAGDMAADDTAPVQALFERLAAQHDVVLADADLDRHGDFLLPALADGEILVQVCEREASITGAYALIKRLQARLGRRPVGVLVTGCERARAATVYRNMAQAASRYLAVELHSLGCVPADDSLRQASRLGRSVVDAFPLADAAIAFRGLAGQVLHSAPLPLEARHV